jgi:predicted ester cyclase
MIGVMAPEPSTAPSAADLSVSYRAYLACLNARAWANLDGFVADDVIYNGQVVGLAGYRRMLERDTTEIPNLRFDLDLLVVDPPQVAARLVFDCTPHGRFLDLDVNGRRVSFSENAFYRIVGDKIAEVCSVIDKAAIERQL